MVQQVSKLTYRDIPLIQTAKGYITAAESGWFLHNNVGHMYHVMENEDNQYLMFRQVSPNSDLSYYTINRETFAKEFE